MAKILLIISALVTAATAYLGFATKQKVDALQGDLSKKTSALTAAQQDLAKTKTSLKKAEEDLTTTKATLEERENDLKKKADELTKTKEDLTKATAEVEDKSKKIAEIEAQLVKIGTKPGENPEDMAKRIQELQESKNRLETELAEARQVQETLNAKVKENTAILAASQRQVQEYKQGFVRNGLTGTILAYNAGWNFAVLSIGDKHGLKPNTALVVTRGGQMIARLKVTSVEPSTAIADIIPSSLARGTTVQPGDAVVFEGQRGN